MRQITADKKLVAFCGLYCGACKAYLRGKCPGCAKNEKTKWCKVRTCCLENKYASCADCGIMADPAECKKLNNIVSKLFALVFRSDRGVCIQAIKQNGYESYAREMASKKTMSIKKIQGAP
jgi:hypothetical protein